MTDNQRVTFAVMSTPAKALATCVIITLALGMLGALGQIWVHDIIPTFYGENESTHAEMPTGAHKAGMAANEASVPAASRGDLFAELTVSEVTPAETTLLQNEQFIWTLKWTHIHLFGMNMIFLFMGALTLFLNVGVKVRTWLIVLPFVGVLTDILAMWLKGFVSPAFFWLHVPGGGAFAVVFGYVSLRALWEMWGRSGARQISKGVQSSF